MIVNLPIRIDFIGSWSDQLDFYGESAVVNGAFGWEHELPFSPYPLSIKKTGSMSSVITGIGTGLGISSVLEAGKYLSKHYKRADYIAHTLDYEQNIGVKGGWQDQIGAVEPGFKLIQTENHQDFIIKTNNDHPILDHIVLFDTGIRRKSSEIGDQMRELLKTKDFQSVISGLARQAVATFYENDAKIAILAILEAWKTLNSYIPMDVEVPTPDESYGYKLVGAGGGGYGVMFVKDPSQRAGVVRYLNKYGYWATVPILLQGINYIK